MFKNDEKKPTGQTLFQPQTFEEKLQSIEEIAEQTDDATLATQAADLLTLENYNPIDFAKAMRFDPGSNTPMIFSIIHYFKLKIQQNPEATSEEASAPGHLWALTDLIQTFINEQSLEELLYCRVRLPAVEAYCQAVDDFANLKLNNPTQDNEPKKANQSLNTPIQQGFAQMTSCLATQKIITSEKSKTKKPDEKPLDAMKPMAGFTRWFSCLFSPSIVSFDFDEVMIRKLETSNPSNQKIPSKKENKKDELLNPLDDYDIVSEFIHKTSYYEIFFRILDDYINSKLSDKQIVSSLSHDVIAEYFAGKCSEPSTKDIALQLEEDLARFKKSFFALEEKTSSEASFKSA